MRLGDLDALKKEVENLVVGGEKGLKDYYENGSKSDENSWIGGVYDAWELIDNAPTVEPEPVSEYQKRALAIVDALTEKHLINVRERGCLRRSILLEPERPQGESIRIEDGMKKARSGNYVIYDVDFLLDNLAREVYIMESTRQWKAGKGNDND